MITKRLVALAAACASLQPAAALDTPSLRARDLHAACVEYAENPDSESGRLCEIYVRGFIAGLQATLGKSSGPETFSERALRTRLGVPAAERACLPEALSPQQLIGHLLAHFETTPDVQHAAASDVLAAVFARFQVCD